MSSKRVKSEYKLKDGTIVRVGDMVRYRWGANDNNVYPLGFVESMEKDYSRWYAKVHILNGTGDYQTLNTRLCEFQRSFELINR
jgi:hypothetical protein